MNAMVGAGGMRVFNVHSYGAVGDDATDNTAAFSACLRSVIAAGGGRMYLPAGAYVGRIIIPAIPRPDWIPLEIVGESQPVTLFGTVGCNEMPNCGTIVRSPATSGGAVISASTRDGFSRVQLLLKNVEVRTPPDPAIGGIDLEWAVQCRIENVVVGTGIYNVQASKPTHLTKGLITPAVNNGALTVLRNVIVTGFHTGIVVNEHTDGDNIVVASNINGLEFVFAHHASRFARVGTYRNTHHVTVSGRHAFSIAQMNTEMPGVGQTNASNAWQTLISDINDPQDLGIGDITYWVVLGAQGAVDRFVKNGGASIRARRIGSILPRTEKAD